MFIAIVLVLLAVGSVAFHLWSPWWATPIASNWSYIDHTITITFWITGVAYTVLLLFMAYCVVRFRHREGSRAAYEPESKRLELWLTGVTSLGVIGMLAPGLFVWRDFITVPKDADVVEVVGQQWLWSYRMPGVDGVLGTSDVRNITDTNSFGINPGDPNGQDDILVYGDDLHLAVGRPTKFLLRSVDVLHNFYVPQFRAKMDMVPGMVTYFWATPTRAERFDVLCAELCGTGHYVMRGGVVVEDEAAYRTWLGEQQTFRDTMVAAAGEAQVIASRTSDVDAMSAARSRTPRVPVPTNR